MSATQIVTGEHTIVTQTIYDAIEARLPSRLALASKLVSVHANAPLQTMTVGNVMGGMRGLPSLLWEISGTATTADNSHSELVYHGKTLRELTSLLPKWPNSKQISPEAMLWYLYTASVPTPAQLTQFAADLMDRAARIQDDVKSLCDSLPPTLSALAQLAVCITANGAHSKFSAAVANGTHKKDLWRHALEDMLDAAVLVPIILARIHANKHRGGQGRDDPFHHKGDLAQNFAMRLGNQTPVFVDLIRLCWAIHMDHGASVSAHVMRLGGSAWTDPFSSLATLYTSGSGLRHAGAITKSIQQTQALTDIIGNEGVTTKEAITAYIKNTVRNGGMIYGYGHAMLRGEDFRLTLVLKFLEERASALLHRDTEGGNQKTEMLNVIIQSLTLIPEVLKKEVPRIKSPAPNVDSLSGSLLCAMGLPEEFPMVVMGCGRCMGGGAQYVWDRALELPLERPLSLTMDQIMARL